MNIYHLWKLSQLSTVRYVTSGRHNHSHSYITTNRYNHSHREGNVYKTQNIVPGIIHTVRLMKLQHSLHYQYANLNIDFTQKTHKVRK